MNPDYFEGLVKAVKKYCLKKHSGQKQDCIIWAELMPQTIRFLAADLPEEQAQ